MEMDGLKADVLRSEVDWQKVSILHAGGSSPAPYRSTVGENAMTGSPPENMEEWYQQDELDQEEGPTLEEEAMAAEMDNCADQNAMEPADDAADPGSPLAMFFEVVDQHAALEQLHTLDVNNRVAGVPASVDHSSQQQFFSANTTASFTARVGTRSACPRKAHTKRLAADEAALPGPTVAVSPACGRKSNPSWIDKVNTILFLPEGELDSACDVDYVPPSCKKQRRGGHGSGSVPGGGGSISDQEVDGSTEDSDTVSEGSWEEGYFDRIVG